MIDQMISCPLCKNSEASLPGSGSITLGLVRGTPYSMSYPQRGNLESSQCSLCRGSRWISEEVYDRLSRNIREEKPKDPRSIIENPIRQIDLDDESRDKKLK